MSEYAEEHGPQTASPDRIAYAIEKLLDWWSDNPVEAVSKATCQGYTEYRRAAGIKDGTIRRELSVLSAAIGHAHDSGRLTSQPKIWMPPPGAPRDRWLTRSEAARLLWEAKSEPKTRAYLPLFILLGLYTAARRDAILTLLWSQVDLERGLVDLNQPGRVQTKKGRAKIQVPRRLITFLRLAKRRSGDLGPVIHIDGRLIGSVKKSFAGACRRANLEAVSPHTLRHTSATWMAQSGVDLWKIAGYLGQTVAATTERYAHHHPDYMQEARAALDRHSVTNSVTK